MPPRKTGYVFHELYMWHNTGSASFDKDIEPYPHWEHPNTKRRIHSLLAVSGVLDKLQQISPRHATEDELAYFHTREHIAHIKSMSLNAGGWADTETPFGKHGFEIALLSAGGGLAAVDAVMEGKVENAYALIRPPGHHAEADKGMGFCLFNNIAIAAFHLKKKYGLKRVAIIDYDVHHGNGTEKAFYEDPGVLFVSIHQDRNYPLDSGFIEHTGKGKGEGFNINVPLPPGSGIGAYLSTLERIVVPALEEYRPEMILVSSGFDASYADPLSAMMASSNVFRTYAESMVEVAQKVCSGRLVFFHEGGYSAIYVPFCGLAVVEGLLGERGTASDPLLYEVENWGCQELQPHQAAIIDKVVDTLVHPLTQRIQEAFSS